MMSFCTHFILTHVLIAQLSKGFRKNHAGKADRINEKPGKVKIAGCSRQNENFFDRKRMVRIEV